MTIVHYTQKPASYPYVKDVYNVSRSSAVLKERFSNRRLVNGNSKMLTVRYL